MSLDRELAGFRATHPPVRLVHQGAEWRYYRGGRGASTALLLGGALGVAEFAFQQIGLLEQHVHVVAPDYPSVGTLGDLLDGLVAVLDEEGVRRAHVVGGSFGGLVAQALVRRHPERIASLVLSHTGAPDPGRRRRSAVAPLALLPTSLLRSLLRRRLGRTLVGADPFWHEYFDRVVAGLSKPDVLSRVWLAAEFAEQAGYAPGDLAAWGGRVLILEADDDPLFPPAAREALRALYPGAEVHTFHGTGHAAAVLRPDEYAAVLLRFFRAAA